MIVKSNIENRVYAKLIKYAFRRSDTIMFVSRKDGLNAESKQILDKNISNLKSEYKNFLLKSRSGSHWVFTKVGYEECELGRKDPPGYNELFEVLFFKASIEMETYMLKNKNLYAWLNPNYPEDICFFKNGYCWLYSVAHEKLCDIFCENEEEYEYLKSIGIEFFEENFSPTPKDELYYEEY